MEISQEQRVEILKKSFAIWPNITVRDTGMLQDGLTVKVRTALTILRLKNTKNEYKLIEVRDDCILSENDPELTWLSAIEIFLYKVKNTFKFWDGETGILDTNQND